MATTRLRCGGFYQIPVQEENGEEQDYFLGILKDRQIHLLGYRPKNSAFAFPVRGCIEGDHGTVEIPDERDTLDDLVIGDVLKINSGSGKSHSVSIIKQPQRYVHSVSIIKQPQRQIGN